MRNLRRLNIMISIDESRKKQTPHYKMLTQYINVISFRSDKKYFPADFRRTAFSVCVRNCEQSWLEFVL